MHGGKIWAFNNNDNNSRNNDKGSTFKFSIPTEQKKKL